MREKLEFARFRRHAGQNVRSAAITSVGGCASKRSTVVNTPFQSEEIIALVNRRHADVAAVSVKRGEARKRDRIVSASATEHRNEAGVSISPLINADRPSRSRSGFSAASLSFRQVQFTTSVVMYVPLRWSPLR